MIRNTESTRSFVMDNRYASLMTRLRMPVNGSARYPKMIGIMGIETTREARAVAAGVAFAAAHDLGDRTLLVDLSGDVSSGSVAPDGMHAPDGAAGWSELVSQQCSLDECMPPESDVENLFVLPRGRAPWIIRPSNFTSVVGTLNVLRDAFDFVVVLLAPANDSTTPAIASQLDGNLLVIESERTKVERAKQAQTVLQNSHVRTLGVVLSNWQDHIPAWFRRLN